MQSLQARPSHVLYLLASLSLISSLALSTAGCDQRTGQPDDAEGETAVDARSLFPVSQTGAWGYIDSSGSVAIQPRFRRAFHFYDGLALVETDSGFGYIDHDGQFAIEPQFEDGWHFAGDVAAVQKDGEWRFVDRNGEMVDHPDLDPRPSAYLESDYQPRDYQLVHSGGKYGFKSESGEVIIDPRFEKAWYFSDGLARVRVDNRWGYIDSTGTAVIEPSFDRAWDFNDGLALVMVDGKYGYIDRSGEFVWSPSE